MLGKNVHIVWSTKEGKRLRITDMETSHIYGALNMLLRKKIKLNRTNFYIEAFKKELIKRTLKEILNESK